MADSDLSDAVALTDLEVIQQFSLAVRGASAPRAAVIRALEADLAYLTSERRRSPAGANRTTTPPKATPAKSAPAAKAPTAAPAAKAASRSAAPAAKRAPAKKASRRA